VVAELGDVEVADPDEELQPEPSDQRERVRRVGGHPHRRMRRLVRARRHHDVLEPVELALEAERLTLPRLADDLEGLDEARLALGVWDAERVVGARGAAAPDAEVEAALAEVVDGRDVLGDPQGVAQRQDLNGRAHAHASGPGGDEAGERDRRRLHRAGRVEVDLAEPHAVEPPCLRRVGQLARLTKGVGLAGALASLLDEDPEVHGAGHCALRRTSS